MLLVAVLLAFLTAACGNDNETTPRPVPSYTGSLTATPGALFPSEPFPNDLENGEAVQVVRETSTLLTWTALMGTCDSDLFTALIDPEFDSLCDNTPKIGSGSLSDYWRIGPIPYTPIDVTAFEDGTTKVTVCEYHPSNIYINPATRAVQEGKTVRLSAVSVYTLTALTETERANALALGVTPPNLRVRSVDLQSARLVDDQCTDVSVIPRFFVDWPDTFAFQQ